MSGNDKSPVLAAKLLRDYHKNNKIRRVLSIIGINLLMSVLLLFKYESSYLACLVLPWAVYLLSFIGHIPFAGFGLFYWGYKIAIMQSIWITYFGLAPSIYTSVMFWIFLVLSALYTLQSTARTSADVVKARDKLVK